MARGGRSLAVGVVLAAVAGISVVATTSAHAAVTPVSRLVLEGESGDYVNGGRHTDQAVLSASASSGFVSVSSPSPETWHVDLRATTDVGPLTPGLYEAATGASGRTPGVPGLDVFGEGRGCNVVAGRFRVDQADYDGSGNLLALAARFEDHCEGGGPASFGTVAYNATVPVYSHVLSAVQMAFPATQPSHHAARSFTITNTTSVAMPVTSLSLAGANPDQFAIGPDNCTGALLPVDASCTATVSFTPSRSGQHSASLVVADAFTSWGSAPTGEHVALSGTAVDPDGGEFHALPPARILDTRTGLGTGGTPHRLSGSETIVFDVGGHGGVPAAGVSAVAVNLTATGSTIGGWLALFPGDESWPGSSSVNFAPGSTVPNMVVMALGADGRLALRNCCGQVDAIVDVVGWYGGAQDAPALAYNTVTPTRVLDTRSPSSPLGAGETRNLAVAGPVVPASASAVVINLTATAPTASTFISAFPSGDPLPTASSLNVGAGETRPNLVTVKVGANGSIALYNYAGRVHLIVDVVGYYDSSRSPQGRIVTGTPVRLFDTRAIDAPLGPQSQEYFDFRGDDGCVHVEAVIFNLTATQATAGTYVTAFPGDIALPTASNVNVGPHETNANLVIVRVPANGQVMFYNNSGRVDLVADLVGVVTLEGAGSNQPCTPVAVSSASALSGGGATLLARVPLNG
jgi:hypothetical protein